MKIESHPPIPQGRLSNIGRAQTCNIAWLIGLSNWAGRASGWK